MQKEDTKLSKAVTGWVNNVPDNQPEPTEISGGVKAFIKDKANPEGKSLGLKDDIGPTMEHGTLLGKTI